MPGKISIASMQMMGKWAEPINKDSIKINVTSGQSKKSKNRLAFSPMTEIVDLYKGYWCFENYWQSGKVYQEVPIEKTKNWWKNLKEPKRRYPGSKDMEVLYSLFDNNDEKMDYVTSRKKIYVPEYYNLIKDNKMIIYWKNKLKDHDLTIYDFDGPKNDDGEITCLELTRELLIEKINDTKFPFGHGYIVAACIAEIPYQEYIS